MGAAFTAPRTDRARLAAATAAVAGITAADALVARRLSQKTGALTEDGAVRVVASLTINRPADELYRYWRNFENLPRFMHHLIQVRVGEDNRSWWLARAPAGKSVHWEAELTDDRPGERIAWRSTDRADIPNAGSVRFAPAPGGRGTVVTVEMEYRPPAGLFGATFARLFGEEPEQQVRGDLRRFKQVMETGEVIRSDATLRGNRLQDQRPAQPPAAGRGPHK
jgi:uncharacterized membrane protein